MYILGNRWYWRRNSGVKSILFLFIFCSKFSLLLWYENVCKSWVIGSFLLHFVSVVVLILKSIFFNLKEKNEKNKILILSLDSNGKICQGKTHLFHSCFLLFRSCLGENAFSLFSLKYFCFSVWWGVLINYAQALLFFCLLEKISANFGACILNNFAKNRYMRVDGMGFFIKNVSIHNLWALVRGHLLSFFKKNLFLGY